MAVITTAYNLLVEMTFQLKLFVAQ
jgi:hypothetical protein